MDPFLQALPPQSDLPQAVQTLHSDPGVYEGRCDIQRGQGRLVSTILNFAGFPRTGRDVPVRVAVVRDGQHWLWIRDFAGHVTRSRLCYDPKTWCVRERFDLVSIWLKPLIVEGKLQIDIQRLTLLRLTVPTILLPRSSTFEMQDDRGRYVFDVSAEAPFLGLLIRYHGWLTPVHDADEID